MTNHVPRRPNSLGAGRKPGAQARMAQPLLGTTPHFSRKDGDPCGET